MRAKAWASHYFRSYSVGLSHGYRCFLIMAHGRGACAHRPWFVCPSVVVRVPIGPWAMVLTVQCGGLMPSWQWLQGVEAMAGLWRQRRIEGDGGLCREHLSVPWPVVGMCFAELGGGWCRSCRGCPLNMISNGCCLEETGVALAEGVLDVCRVLAGTLLMNQ